MAFCISLDVLSGLFLTQPNFFFQTYRIKHTHTDFVVILYCIFFFLLFLHVLFYFALFYATAFCIFRSSSCVYLFRLIFNTKFSCFLLFHSHPLTWVFFVLLAPHASVQSGWCVFVLCRANGNKIPNKTQAFLSLLRRRAEILNRNLSFRRKENCQDDALCVVFLFFFFSKIPVSSQLFMGGTYTKRWI